MIDVKDVPHFATSDLLRFLIAYGYVDRDQVDTESIYEGTKLFQEHAGLRADGVLGPKTHRVVLTPRCGVSDASIRLAQEQLNKWGRRELTYFVKAHDRDLTVEEWKLGLRKALNSWEEVANLKFEEVQSSGKANLVFDVGSGRGSGFDGPGGTLAWAYLPPSSNYKGQLLCKFDLGETWILDSRLRGILLENVACHETGHLLGLGHSRVRTALMAPYYSPSVPKPVKHDDVSRIQRLYGKPQDTPDPVPPVPPVDPDEPPKDNKLTVHLEFTGSLKDVQIPGYRVYKQQ